MGKRTTKKSTVSPAPVISRRRNLLIAILFGVSTTIILVAIVLGLFYSSGSSEKLYSFLRPTSLVGSLIVMTFYYSAYWYLVRKITLDLTHKRLTYYIFGAGLPYFSTLLLFFFILISLLLQGSYLPSDGYSVNRFFADVLNVITMSVFMLYTFTTTILITFPELFIITILCSLIGFAYVGYSLFKQKKYKLSIFPLLLLVNILLLLGLGEMQNNIENSGKLGDDYWVNKPTSVFGKTLSAIENSNEIVNLKRVEPLGWDGNENVVYKTTRPITGEAIYSYNLKTRSTTRLNTLPKLHQEYCSKDSNFDYFNLQHTCLKPRNLFTYARPSEILFSPDGKWAFMLAKYLSEGNHLVILDRSK